MAAKVASTSAGAVSISAVCQNGGPAIRRTSKLLAARRHGADALMLAGVSGGWPAAGPAMALTSNQTSRPRRAGTGRRACSNPAASAGCTR